MHEELIANIRARAEQLRKVVALAHDPRMIEALEKIIAQADADIERLEADQAKASHEIPPPRQR
jgi:hypothetical protein